VSALKDAGAKILVASGATPADRIISALTDLGRREITSLFLEGGRTLASAFASADQLDESRTFIAPVLLGGSKSSEASFGRLTALESHVEPVGEDTLITARFKEW
jgi:diaminohydroxyphosphoribosylaminopyrimidine deaminase/5-amino-6-(5-phosphoribosylamino)uracil reductase